MNDFNSVHEADELRITVEVAYIHYSTAHVNDILILFELVQNFLLILYPIANYCCIVFVTLLLFWRVIYIIRRRENGHDVLFLSEQEKSE